jgi:hypothetical protein
MSIEHVFDASSFNQPLASCILEHIQPVAAPPQHPPFHARSSSLTVQSRREGDPTRGGAPPPGGSLFWLKVARDNADKAVSLWSISSQAMVTSSMCWGALQGWVWGRGDVSIKGDVDPCVLFRVSPGWLLLLLVALTQELVMRCQRKLQLTVCSFV